MSLESSVLYSNEYREKPEPVWEQMRNEYPLFYDEVGKIWWLTRYQDVVAFFSDHETFSSSTYELTTGQVVGPTLISRDDYGHVVRRSIVAPDFVGKRLKSYQSVIEDCSRRLIERFSDNDEVALVRDFSSLLPVDVISSILGMVGDGHLFRQWVTDMIMGLSGSPKSRERGLEANRAFCEHITPLLEDVDDLNRIDHIAKIARAEVDGHRLTEKEITAFCGLLFIAGGETTDKAIANMWWNVLTHPDVLKKIEEDPELWSNAFSETMRRTPPVISEDRFTTLPIELHGTEIPKGARVRACMGAAHLDPTVFQSPNEFDLFRSDLHLSKELRSGGSKDPQRSGHLGFGLGKHFCIGYELARAEAVIGSQLIVDQCGLPQLADPELRGPVIQGNSFMAVSELRLRFKPN
jgi:pulcherriminic acid synthase